MKKINLSRKSKLLIGGIGSLAVLATIPAAVVACSSTTVTDNQSSTTALVAKAYSAIQNSYTTTNSTIKDMGANAVNINNIASVIASANILPALTNNPTWSYVFSAPTSTTAGTLTFNVSISTGPYSLIKSSTKTVSLSGFSTTQAAAFPSSNVSSTDTTAFTNFINSINKKSFAVNSLGQTALATITSGTGSSATTTTSITGADIVSYINNLPAINYNNITFTSATPTVISGSTDTLSVVLTFAGGPSSNNTATITLTGFLATTPSTTQINQVQESLNNYLINLIVNNQALGVLSTLKQSPKDLLSTSATTSSSSQVNLKYSDILQSTSAGAKTLAFSLPANINLSDINITVLNSSSPLSDSFSVLIQIKGSSISGVEVAIIANSENPAS